MIVIGIDPGVTGAIARLSHGHAAIVEDMPAMLHPTSKMMRNQIAGDLLVDSLRRLFPAFEEGIAAVEDIHSFGNGRASASMMMSRGIIDCALRVCRFVPIWVPPRVWQKFHKFDPEQGTGKESLRVARGLYPAESLMHLNRQCDHNRADALLIATWAKFHFGD